MTLGRRGVARGRAGSASAPSRCGSASAPPLATLKSRGPDPELQQGPARFHRHIYSNDTVARARSGPATLHRALLTPWWSARPQARGGGALPKGHSTTTGGGAVGLCGGNREAEAEAEGASRVRWLGGGAQGAGESLRGETGLVLASEVGGQRLGVVEDDEDAGPVEAVPPALS